MIGLGILVTILELIRKRKLREEYSVLWFATAIGILVLSLWFPLLEWLTALLGVVWPATTLFLFGLIFLVLISLHFSIKVSRLTDQVKDLAQEAALLSEEVSRFRAQSAVPEARPDTSSSNS
ncbi:MAG: hypothetical protein A2V83_07375 [Nitrospirae bacterium RBG_16_64_22]|nr:MAG: hypothetical protein A2V83_07375 [Nitrospirae bacterium RBG_16_64_22]